MFCRKLVFSLYVFQTILSSLPPPCYGMELDPEIAYSKGRKSIQEDRKEESSRANDSTSLEIAPLLDSSKKNTVQGKKTKAQETKDPIVLLNGYLNYYLDKEKSHLFPEYYKEFDTTLEVKTALIDPRKKPENEGLVDNRSVDNSPFNWDEGFVLLEGIDKKFVQRGPSESLPLEWQWRLLQGVGVLGCGGITLLYAVSPFGIDPTRLTLINTALPLEIQSAAAIGLSASFVGYHILPHAMEGWNTSTRLYKRFFVNWGLSDSHGFMTRENDEHKALRDLASLRESKKKEGILEASRLAQTQEIEATKANVLKEPHITDIDWKNERCRKLLGDRATNLLGKAVKYGMIGFIGVMYALLYTMTFLDAELSNDQSAYAYAFVGAVFAFIFGTTVDNGCTEWDRSNHRRANKANPILNHKKKALIHTLDKTKEFINSNTANSNGFVNEIYNKYTQEEQEGAEFNLSKFSLLFLKVSYPNAPEDPVLKTLDMTMFKVTKPHRSWLTSTAEKVGTFGVGAWAIPAFFVFWSVANSALMSVHMPRDVAYWTSIPISGSVSLFGIMEGWKQQPRIYAKLLDHLSPSHPLFLLKWLFFTTGSFSALWSTSSYVGVLSDLLGTSLPLAKYTLYSLSLFTIAKFLSWELERWDDLTRIALTNSWITRYFNTTKQKRLYLNHEIERAKETIFEWDGETTDQFTYLLWDMF